MYILDHRPMQPPLKSYVDDLPASVCPVIQRFAQIVERGVLDETRREEMMMPLIPRMLDTTASVETQLERAFQILDWEVRKCAPAKIRVFESLEEYAGFIESSPPIIDSSRLDFMHSLADEIAQESRVSIVEPTDEYGWLWAMANDIKTTIAYAKRGYQDGLPLAMLGYVHAAPVLNVGVAMRNICLELQRQSCELLRHLCTVTATE